MSASVFRDLTKDQRKRLVAATTTAVRESFSYAPSATTGAEIKRRAHICLDLVGVLRGDLHWSITRVEDHLRLYLKCELLGIAYDPKQNTRGWVDPTGVELSEEAARLIVPVS